MARPYQRVVGVAHEKAHHWAPESAHGGYVRSRVDEEELDLGEITEERIATFFGRYLTCGGGPSYVGPWYRCHSFAHFVATGQRAESWVGARVDDRATTQLSIGQRGLILGKERSRTWQDHSVVGLGVDQDRCLQVLATRGPMAITGIEQIRQFYDAAHRLATHSLRRVYYS